MYEINAITVSDAKQWHIERLLFSYIALHICTFWQFPTQRSRRHIAKWKSNNMCSNLCGANLIAIADWQSRSLSKQTSSRIGWKNSYVYLSSPIYCWSCQTFDRDLWREQKARWVRIRKYGTRLLYMIMANCRIRAKMNERLFLEKISPRR